MQTTNTHKLSRGLSDNISLRLCIKFATVSTTPFLPPWAEKFNEFSIRT